MSQSDKAVVVHVTDDSFDEEVRHSDRPVLLDFWAEWCIPCKMIAPVLDQIAKEYVGSIKVCKIDIDSNPNTPRKYGIHGVPTLILFKDGEVDSTRTGALSKSQLKAFLDSNVDQPMPAAQQQ